MLKWDRECVISHCEILEKHITKLLGNELDDAEAYRLSTVKAEVASLREVLREANK